MKSDKPNKFQTSVFDFIVDISSSMSDDLPKMKVKLVELVTKITNITNNWEIKITPFSTNPLPTKSFDSDNDQLTEVSKYIDKLAVESSTALYNTMH